MLLALPVGLGIGLALGAVGGGGAVLAVPVLVYVFGEDVHAATTASLLVVGVAGLAGGAAQARGDLVCWRVGLIFVAPALAGGVAGTALNELAGGTLLLATFAVVMLLAAVVMWRRGGAAESGSRFGDAGCPPLALRRTLPVGFAIGLLTGFLGVGGGFLVVPALTLWLYFGLRRAIGTSLLIVSLVSLAGLAAHLLAGSSMDWSLGVALAGATALGAVAGGAISSRLPRPSLARGFAGLIAVTALAILAASLAGEVGPA